MSQNHGSGASSSQDCSIERRIARVSKVSLYVAMASIVGLVFVVVAHTTGRYGFDRPIAGVAEFSCFILAMLVYLVAGYTQVVKGHIAIGIFTDRFSERRQAIINSITYSICLVVIVIAAWQGVINGNHMLEVGQTSTVLGVSESPFMYVIVFGWVMLGLVMGLHLFHFVRTVIKGRKE